MKKIFALVACLSLVASLAVGGSIAYLQDQEATVNVMTLGKVEIEQIEEQRVDPSKNGTLTEADIETFKQGKPLLPYVDVNLNGAMRDDYEEINFPDGNTYRLFIGDNAIDKFISVKNTGKSEAYVRTIIALEQPTQKIDLAFNATSDWKMDKTASSHSIEVGGVKYDLFVCYYDSILKPDETTPVSLLQIILDGTATNEDAAAYGDTYDVLALSQAVQASGFEDIGAAAALDTAFGVVNAENAAKWFVDEDITNSIPVTVKNADELAAAVAAGKTNIILNDGEYDVYGCAGKTLTLSGSRNAVLKLKNEGEDGCDYAFGDSAGVGNVTFNGVTIDTTANTGNYKGFAYMKGTFNDCAFVGAYSLNNANDFEFNNCEFDFKNGYFWTWGANSATFNNCTFNGNSKAILAHGYASTKINIKDCNFAATEEGYTGADDWTAAVEIDPAGSNTYTITFSGNNTKTDKYNGWTRIKDGSTGHTITGVN